jgi:glycosyltransferase involved in cell wall biosynthesis
MTNSNSFPLVSIIIPFKDAEPFLAATIESCLSQTWPRTEIIVVDNGSRDKSRLIAASYVSQGVIVTSCDRPGAAAARNAGLKKSTGDYIQFLDADDILDECKIEQQLRRLSKETRDTTAICGWAAFHEESHTVIPADGAIFRDHEPCEFLAQLWTTRTMMAPFAWLISRDVIERAGVWSEDLSWDDDGEFFARVALASRNIVCCPEILGYYRRHAPGILSLSRRRDREALTSAFVACQRATAALLAHESSLRTRMAAAAKYLFFVHFAYPDLPQLVRQAECEIRNLGGKLEPSREGSLKYLALSKLIGWKLARRFQVHWLRVTGRTHWS